MLVDPKLIVDDGVNSICRKCHFKINAVVAIWRVHFIKKVMRQLKAHVWYMLEVLIL